MKLALRVYFRRVFISGEHHFPQKGPVVLASNHPNSFLDAIFLATYLNRPLHFLVRGDVFNTPLKRWILGKFNQLPIYRSQEGYNNLHRNRATFDACHEILEKDGVILIFSEGLSIFEKRLRKLKKGTARLIVETLQQPDSLPVTLLPVGLNYTEGNRFRKELMVDFGGPVDLNAIDTESTSKAVNDITRQLEQTLSSQVITLNKSSEPLTEEVLKVYRKRLKYPILQWKFEGRNRFEQEQKIAHAINTMDEQSQETIAEIEREVAIVKKGAGYPRPYLANNWTTYIFLELAWPIFLVGYIGNVLPLWVANKITTKKVRLVEFYSSVQLAIGFALYPIYILLLIIVTIVTAPTYWFVPLLLIPLGYFTLFYQELFYALRGTLERYLERKRNPEAILKLQTAEENLRSRIDKWLTLDPAEGKSSQHPIR